MAYKIIINPSARLDIIEAIKWYNEHQSNLEFQNALQLKLTNHRQPNKL